VAGGGEDCMMKGEMGWTRGMYGGKHRCIPGFGREGQRKETTQKT
jgi:hypothetical protein